MSSTTHNQFLSVNLMLVFLNVLSKQTHPGNKTQVDRDQLSTDSFVKIYFHLSVEKTKLHVASYSMYRSCISLWSLYILNSIEQLGEVKYCLFCKGEKEIIWRNHWWSKRFLKSFFFFVKLQRSTSNRVVKCRNVEIFCITENIFFFEVSEDTSRNEMWVEKIIIIQSISFFLG